MTSSFKCPLEIAARAEVEHYLARVRAERMSQDQPDDASADAVRLAAPEIVPGS